MEQFDYEQDCNLEKESLVRACASLMVEIGAITPDEVQQAIQLLEQYSKADLVTTMLCNHSNKEKAAELGLRQRNFFAVDTRYIGAN